MSYSFSFFLPEPRLNFPPSPFFCLSHSFCSFPRLVSRDQVSHPAQDCLSRYTQFVDDFTVPNFKYIVLVSDILGTDYILKMHSISVNKLLILTHSLRRIIKMFLLVTSCLSIHRLSVRIELLTNHRSHFRITEVY